MQQSEKKPLNKILAAILSMSLLTVMAGAAIAPALGNIKAHFANSSLTLVQLIISMPAFFIILTNFAFPILCKLFKTRTIAILGLILYVISGCLPIFFDSIVIILIFRAILGISVGMIMPLSTGLISFYFPPEKQASLMGISAAMNQMGGIIATLLAGILASMQWNYSFLVYGLGAFVIILIAFFLPNEKLMQNMSKAKIEHKISLMHRLIKYHPSICGMFLCMGLFFVFPSNFAIIAHNTTSLSDVQITIIMVALDIVAFFVGLLFGRLMNLFHYILKYFAPIGFGLGYATYVFYPSVTGLLVGSLFIGIANGIGIPYLNTIASIKGGKTAATTIMPLLSASLYAGQFISPILITSLGHTLFDEFLKTKEMQTIYAPYIMAILFAIIYLIQAFATRNYQRLPPKSN